MATLIKVIATELVTPQLAFYWIGTNRQTRHLDMQAVVNLVQRMRAGVWEPEAAPLVLDQWDRLVDGQHRCHAIVLHGKGVVVAVSREKVVNG